MKKPTKLEPCFQKLALVSPSEYRVFMALGAGVGTRRLAESTYRSIKTIESQVSALRKKLGVNGIHELVVLSCKFQERYGQPELKSQVIHKRLIFENKRELILSAAKPYSGNGYTDH